MAKSLRSKWKRKMRAIKREKMDEKVLVRLKNMLATAEAEQHLIPLPSKDNKKKRDEPTSNEAETVEDSTVADDCQSTSDEEMETEQVSLKKKKASLKTMKNSEGKFPAWMSVKKIRRHKRIVKMKQKRCSKEAKMTRNWRIATSV